MIDIFNDLGVQVELLAKPGISDPKERFSDSFHVVKETLTRIGIASKQTKTLYQSCHILHKRGQYAILHFKELFKLDGKPANISAEDISRRNTIVQLLAEWGLVKIKDQIVIRENTEAPVKIVSYSDKKHWNLKSKYSIGGEKLIGG
jgi:hypothetical protein